MDLTPIPRPRSNMAMTKTPIGVLVFGGVLDDSAVTFADLYDPENSTWSKLDDLPEPMLDITASYHSKANSVFITGFGPASVVKFNIEL
jgi:hypothetical protein